MTIKIEFYGRLKEDFNATSTEWTFQPDTTVEALYQSLCDTHQVTTNIHVVRPIINDTFVDWQQHIAPHDVVGFFPPASGG